MREYKRFARQMVSLQPDSMKYRMEEQYADINLGVVLLDQRRFPEAVNQFRDALRTMQAISTADPANKDYKQNFAEAFAWLADAEYAIGDYDRAIADRQQNIALYDQLLARSADVKFREHLIPAMRALGNLYEERGQRDLAAAQYKSAIAEADKLIAVEPGNTVWLEYGMRGHLDLARISLAGGATEEAAAQTTATCGGVHALLQRGTKPQWQIALASCLTLRAQLAVHTGSNDEALELATQAVAILRSAQTVDKVADAVRLARAYQILGDIHTRRGDLAAARAEWSNALQAFPANVFESPSEMAVHAIILQRLGRNAEAQPLAAKLNAFGYRLPLRGDSNG